MPDTYQITTEDGSVYEIETEGSGKPSAPAMGLQDFREQYGAMNGLDDSPRGAPGILEQMGRSAFKSMAQPESGMDFMGLMGAIPGLLRTATGGAQAASGMLRAATPGPKTGRVLEVVGKNLPTPMDPLRPFRGGMVGAGKWLQKPAGAAQSGAGAASAPVQAASEAALPPIINVRIPPGQPIDAVSAVRHGVKSEDAAAELARLLGTPSNAEVAGTVVSKNIRTTPQYGGTKKPHITAEEFVKRQREAMLKALNGQ